MKLRASEILVLQKLDQEPSIKKLAEKIDRSPSYTSELIADLESKNLVATRRRGKEKHVQPVKVKAIEILQNIHRQYPHVDLPELVSGKAIQILYYLDEPRKVAELSELTCNYRNTVNRIVKRLQKRGVLMKRGTIYILTDDFQPLADFAQEYVHYRHRRKAAEKASQHTIIWEDLREFLFQTSNEVKNASIHETGPKMFQKYGLPLMTTERNYYLYSEEFENLTVPELVCHTLLIDDGARFRTYCLLLVVKTGTSREKLRKTAEKYNLSKTTEELINYLKTKGDESKPCFPSWEEFKSTAADYEVKL